MGKQEFGKRIVDCALTWKGTPFFPNLRKKGNGVDCLGLVLGVWEEVNEVSWNGEISCDFHQNYRPHKNLDFQHFEKTAKIYSIEKRMIGDVVCINLAPDQWHLAILNAKNIDEFIIHSRSNIGVVEEIYSNFWKSRTTHIYRLTEV